MRINDVFFIPVLLFASTAARAEVVVYTTPDHPVLNPDPGVVVQVLEDVKLLEQQLFPLLSDIPADAERQARARLLEPDWKTQEAHLTRVYQALLDAHTTGITKVPAVVFDNRYVVYGTTDISLAQTTLDAWREQRP